jgi:hypothetical protein
MALTSAFTGFKTVRSSAVISRLDHSGTAGRIAVRERFTA